LDDVRRCKHRVSSLHTSHAGLKLTYPSYFARVNGSTTFTPLKPVEVSFASELIPYWLPFVQAGNRNTFKLRRSPLWKPYKGVAMNQIVLQQNPAGTTTLSGSFLEREVNPETQRCTVIGG
jgi:hypothetical protein